jgi:ribulose kinase
MATTRQPTFVPGVWGPYFSSMIPNLWLNEAGQSAAGAAVAQLVEMHPASAEAKALAAKDGLDLVTWLEHAALDGTTPQEVVWKAGAIHVVPDFNGNRSPFADPEARAIIAGLGTDRSIASLTSLYVAGVCGVAYGLGQIVAALAAKGIQVERLIVSGGVAKSRLARQILADATQLPIGVPESAEPVLLGAAMLGATASRHYATLADAMAAMSHIASWDRPSGGAIADFHRARADAYARLQEVERSIRAPHQQV